jgi:magnesium transporter
MQIDMYFNFIDKKFDKLYGHILQTQEYLDQVRQSYEAQIDIQQNSLMKVFTVVTSIFLPLSLITGWYGMNLMMPEFAWVNGYPFVIGLCITIVLFMLWLFRKNKWI